MKKINYKFNKNDEEIESHLNVNAININNQLYFKIDDIKYNYINNKLIKEKDEEIIILDFDNNLCSIELNKKYSLNVKIIHKSIDKSNNKIKIKYRVETEEDVLNEIIIEYI